LKNTLAIGSYDTTHDIEIEKAIKILAVDDIGDF
jgi:hypothetical protein